MRAQKRSACRFCSELHCDRLAKAENRVFAQEPDGAANPRGSALQTAN